MILKNNAARAVICHTKMADFSGKLRSCKSSFEGRLFEGRGPGPRSKDLLWQNAGNNRQVGEIYFRFVYRGLGGMGGGRGLDSGAEAHPSVEKFCLLAVCGWLK